MPGSTVKVWVVLQPWWRRRRFPAPRVFHTHEYHERENAEDFAFVQAYGWDNVQWCLEALRVDGQTENDFYSWSDKERFDYFIKRSQYGRELGALPQAMRIGHLLGSFDKFAGQYFDVFDPAKHVGLCNPVGERAERWMGIDWAPSRDRSLLVRREDGKTKVYREYCKTDRTPASAAQQIIDFTPKEERRHIRNIFISHDAFAERTDPNTIALQMTEIFMRNGMAQPTKAPKNPIAGALLIYDMLQRCELLIDSSCHKLMECIPMVTRDEEEPRNTVKFEGDDPYEAFKYGLQGHYAPVEPSKSQNDLIAEEIDRRIQTGR